LIKFHEIYNKDKKNGGYFEGDLNRLKQQLIKLNDTVQRFNEQIRIDTTISKNIDWDSLLFVMPNKGIPPPVAPPNPNLYSSYQHRSSLPTSVPMSMPMPPQNFYSNTPTPRNPSRSLGNQGRSASISMGSRPSTYTCIGCKTTNVFNENGRNICSTCRCPAPF